MHNFVLIFMFLSLASSWHSGQERECSGQQCQEVRGGQELHHIHFWQQDAGSQEGTHLLFLLSVKHNPDLWCLLLLKHLWSQMSVYGCVLTCLCVSAVNAGSVTGSERSGSTRLSDPGAQPARAAEQGRSRRPTVWLHRSHDELHPAGKTQECLLSSNQIQSVYENVVLQ